MNHRYWDQCINWIKFTQDHKYQITLSYPKYIEAHSLIIINWLLESDSLHPKVIPLMGFHFIFFHYAKWQNIEFGLHYVLAKRKKFWPFVWACNFPPSHSRDYSTCNNARLELSTISVPSFDSNEWCLKNGLHSGGFNAGPLGHESSALTTRPRLLEFKSLRV